MKKKLTSSPARRLRSLDETLAYQNDLVLYKFMESYRVSLRQARDLFTEVKRWLWVCARAREVPSAPRLTVIGRKELWIVDELWHTFVLFTPVYREFCRRYLGRFIDHVPATREDQERERARWRADPEGFQEEKLAALERELTFVGEELGPATIRKWFTTLARKYTPEQMDRLRIPYASEATVQGRRD